MATTRRKQATSKALRTRSRARPFERGVDGLTAADRFQKALAELPWTYSESEMIRRCNRLWGLPEDAEKPAISQQILNGIVNGQVDLARSSFLPLIAEALEVRALWLQRGIGPKEDDKALRRRLTELLGNSPG